MDVLSRAEKILEASSPVTLRGLVTDVTGLVVEASGPAVGVGTMCHIVRDGQNIPAQVVGFRRDRVLLMPHGDLQGVAPGACVIAHRIEDKIPVGPELLGRVIDPMGEPIDGKGKIVCSGEVSLFRSAPSPMERARISSHFDSGLKAVNALLTIGRGQRVGVMAGSGVGKSTLLGMIARHARSSVNVIALVGERGREVREFIERDLGEEGLKRSIVVVSTSDRSPLTRVRAAFAATAIAEYFRDLGEEVSLLLDSVTRFCMAQREIGLAVGEPPTAAGYTPSVFALLPRLLERAGTCGGKGSITGFYAVLVEGDDMNEPIADAVRGIVDGHIVLSRALASRGQYPAIDVLQSVSRLMPDVVDAQALELAAKARQILADFSDVEDLITIGAYKEGQNRKTDYAVQRIEALRRFLLQKPEEKVAFGESRKLLSDVL